ncbi:MAG: hypothetical protein QM723_01950 [Myxococcaceae bacterium]
MRIAVCTTAVLLAACGGSTPDPHPEIIADCDVTHQTGCDGGYKCSVRMLDGNTHCVPPGPKQAYTDCTTDDECVAGTTCISTPANAMFKGGQFCHPDCDPTTQAHQACSLGGSCEVEDFAVATAGFCVMPQASDGGTDGGP